MVSTILRGGTVLTLGARTQNHHEADVLIEDGRISEVGSGLRARGARVIDASNTIVMPGFVDTHRHAWRSLFRNAGGARGSGPTPAEYGPHHTPDDVYAATLIALIGSVRAGTTTVVDWYDGPSPDPFIDAALSAHADAGLRTVFVGGTPTWSGERAGLGGRLASLSTGDRTHVAFGSPDPDTMPAAEVDEAWTAARSDGLRIHAHVGMDAGTGGVAELGRRGLLGDDVTLIHCSRLDAGDLDAIKSSGASVSLTPSSEMAGGLGAPPIQPLIDRDVRPGLGVDDEWVAPGDMFAQMRAINSIQHATMFDLKLAGKANLPKMLTTREVIRYATIDGARVAGVGDVAGSIEPGKQADIVVLRADRPNIAPVNDPIGAVVWGMDTSNVDWVFVGGEALMEDGSLTADVSRARELATTAQRRVGGAAGLLETSGGPA